MRTIIAGSRDVTDMRHLLIALESARFDITSVISGGARDADRLGERWARERNIPLEVMHANWRQHGLKAGMLRNREMARNADALIALWDGESSGTRDMIAVAASRALDVFIYLVPNEKRD